MVYISNREHDNPHELLKDNLEGSLEAVHHDYTHTDILPKIPEEIEKLEYIYQHFQDDEKIYETDPQVTTEQTDDTLYPQINNDIEYGLFKNVINSYYLKSQIRDDFQCTKTCYTCHDLERILRVPDFFVIFIKHSFYYSGSGAQVLIVIYFKLH